MKAMKKDLTMWQYMCYMCAIILMLCGITFLLSSCTEEIISAGDKPKGSGKMVEVKFAMNSSSIGAPETVTTRNARDMQPETVEVPLGDNLFMFATLDIDRNIKLRAATELLVPKVKVRIVAYKNGSNKESDGYAEYTVNASGELTGGSLQVEEGQYYRFVAYSDNSTNTSLAWPAHGEIVVVQCVTDLLWGESGMIEIDASTTVHITMQHKFSQVSFVASTEDNPHNPTPPSNDIPYTSPNIQRIDGLTLSPGYSVKLTVKDGTLSWAKDEFRSWHYGSWSTYGNTTVSCSPGTIYTDGKDSVVVKIDSLRLSGYTKPFTKLVAKFDKKLLPGVSYIFYLHFKKGVMWAGSNIYWNGSYLTFSDYQDRSREGYQGVFFKWGSLVGIQPCRTSGSPSSTPNFSDAYIYVPAYNAADPINSSWSASTQSDWSYILPVTNSSDNTDRDDKYLTKMGSANYLALKGDICQYLGDTGKGPKGYRMPTSNEMGNTVGYWSEANPGHVAGGWMRVGADADFFNITDYQPNNTNVPSQAGRWENKKDALSGPSGAKHNGAFFPTSGWRNTLGVLAHVGVYGYYWSSTIGGNDSPGGLYRAFNLEISATGLKPAEFLGGVRESTALSCAMPIRCVKKNPDEI